MDENSYKLEQQLQALQKQQRETEDKLLMLKREQNEQEWLEEDFARHCQLEMETMASLRELWQGDEARNFAYYLEDIHEEEKKSWRKNILSKREKQQEKINNCQKTLYQIEREQQSIQKELTR
ncbi:DNA double-strand break repair Rad50 ATPase [Listeria seeligeri]|uniref:DNA double-strand break repair Rad50 ATPase n=1 Tax=Listeria seeligeri TaxID=1640 RepID=UPI00194251BC|nr:DNA double-strand break repair Rad50 ATPase [Listeria seeligeri]MBM5606217.1 DNA double-strand break repair Rad50 ATPase [Listeria seeligeri]MBM5677682.1 DNA double-strand break repair Rad50 ATPase [Listeria seeligeri]